MNLTIIPSDNFVRIDGEKFELNPMPDCMYGINAVQFKGHAGEVEYVDDRLNLKIKDVGPFQAVIDACMQIRAQVELEKTSTVSVKKVQIEQLKLEYNRVLRSGVTVSDRLFDTTPAALQEYLMYEVHLLQDPIYEVEDWEVSDNVWVTMDSVLYGRLKTKIKNLRKNAKQWYRTQKNLVNQGAVNVNLTYDKEL